MPVASAARRILLAVEPRFLEGALAKLLAARLDVEVVQVGQNQIRASHSRYDAAVVSVEVPKGVQADVVITLPDTYGSAGTGTVRSGDFVREVSMSDGERLIDLIEKYVPCPPLPQP